MKQNNECKTASFPYYHVPSPVFKKKKKKVFSGIVDLKWAFI